MPDYYFVSGYTGFCPKMPEKIGQNYCNSTREVFRDLPQMRSRLGDVHWREAQTGDVAFRSGNAYQCHFSPEIPSCNRDDSTGRCPLKAHPLACTQFGSPCMDKCCDTDCCDQRPRNQGDAEFLVCENEANSRHFKECHPCLKPELVCYPGSCSPGGPCGEDLECCVKLPKPKPRPPLPNCNPCVKDPEEMKRPAPVTSGRGACDCCCSKIENDEVCESERPVDPDPCLQYKFRKYKMRPYRKCGVIPNYMGYIPGMLMTFGETYGITANRLLKRHFSEQSKMGY